MDTSDFGDRCPDCGCRKGHYHHHNCDIEECPACCGQMLSFFCDITIFTTK
ncbi:MAG: hypothetical protein ACOX5M_03960 [Bacillota bacterium]